ncbi:MAG: 3-dehydroquinate synthase [Candidatus Sumerlaeaceae bacterium]|nr:3-dehydroquinate synthase [Candidatus Sumerlaeaceae bacterium]
MTESGNATKASWDPLRVDLGERSYDIRFYNNATDALVADIKALCPERAFVVTNETIWSAQGERFGAAMQAAGVDFTTAMVGDGEKYKTLDSASALYDRLLEERFSRRATVIAFGGGVIGDLAGFVAATFLRGVRFIQVPTTVVAMVDSSIGGKTGVDHRLGKNLIGAFYQPALVAVDLAYLKTLDDHNRHGGFAEIIKYGVIYDAALFDYLEKNVTRALKLESEPLLHVTRRSCEIKAAVVGQDEFEGGLRAILNFGHTFAHAIESVGEYKERQFHGQAVAIGMVAAGELACRLGMFSAGEQARLVKLIETAGLPTRIPEGMKAEQIVEGMKSDKKVVSGRQRFVLPTRLGEVVLRDDVETPAVLKLLRDLGAT